MTSDERNALVQAAMRGDQESPVQTDEGIEAYQKVRSEVETIRAEGGIPDVAFDWADDIDIAERERTINIKEN